jgi:hypothetical protein
VSPTSMEYTLPMYWRITVWGGAGTIEGSWNYPQVMLYKEGDKAGHGVPNAPARKGGFVDSFLRQVHGQPSLSLTTADALRATFVSLKTQETADQDLRNVLL